MAPPAPRQLWMAALGLGAFQFVGSFGAAGNQPSRKPIDAVALALVVAGPAALAFAHRRPLVAVAVAAAAADISVALGYPYGPIFFAVAVSLFVAVQAGHRRSAWMLAALGFAGFVVAGVVDPNTDGGDDAGHLVLVVGWLALVLALSEVFRIRHAQRVERERAEDEQRQRLVGEQRLQLAQELHDVLAHNISLINVQAGVALHILDSRPEQARPALTNIKAASREALQELRAALDLLRHGVDAPLAPAPRLADLQVLVEGVRAGGLDVHLDQEAVPGPLPAAVELAAYRIVQEALTNVNRHAGAQGVFVRVAHDDGGLTVEVVDDGAGGAAGPGNGISGMRERAVALGGTLDAGPRREGGFGVTAHLPLTSP